MALFHMFFKSVSSHDLLQGPPGEFGEAGVTGLAGEKVPLECCSNLNVDCASK